MRKGNGSGKVDSAANASEGAANSSNVTKTAVPTAEAPGQSPRPPASILGTTFERARELVNRHPVGIVFLAAGAGALYAAERAVGALGGIGGKRLFRGATAPELRDQIRRQREQLLEETKQRGEKLKQQGEQLFARGKNQGEQLVARGKNQGEQLLKKGRSVWPFNRRPPEPTQPSAQA